MLKITMFYSFWRNPILGWLLESILVIWVHFGGPFWRPFWSLFEYHLHQLLDPKKTSRNGGAALAVLCQALAKYCTLTPSSDSSPLVKPCGCYLRCTTRTGQGRAFRNSCRQLPYLLLRQDRCLLLRQDRCLLLRQDRCLLLRQDRCLLLRHDR